MMMMMMVMTMTMTMKERQNTDWESAASFHKDDSGLLQAAILWKT